MSKGRPSARPSMVLDDEDSRYGRVEGERRSLHLTPKFDERLKRIFQVLIILVIVVIALDQLRGIFIPFFLALLMFFLIRPLVRKLHESDMPTWLAYTLSIWGVFLVLGVTAWVVTIQVMDLQDDLPTYEQKLTDLSHDAESISIFGWSPDLSAVDEAISGPAFQDFLLGAGQSAISVLATTVTALVFLIFIALEAGLLPKRLEKVLEPEMMERVRTVAARAEQGINEYLAVKTMISLGTGTVASLIMLAFNLDLWILWGFLTFALNYVPLIGSVIATIPPALLSFIVMEPGAAITMIILLTANQQLFGSFIEPQFTGKRLDISPLVLLLVVAFCSWLWGLVGMILAVPMAMITKIILLSVDETWAIGMLMAAGVPDEEE